MITYKEAYFILQYVNMIHLSKAIFSNFSFIWENWNVCFTASCANLLYLVRFQLRENS